MYHLLTRWHLQSAVRRTGVSRSSAISVLRWRLLARLACLSLGACRVQQSALPCFAAAAPPCESLPSPFTVHRSTALPRSTLFEKALSVTPALLWGRLVLFTQGPAHQVSQQPVVFAGTVLLVGYTKAAHAPDRLLHSPLLPAANTSTRCDNQRRAR